jgi:viroplasmin and RNaseH domain-containing protein
MHKVELEIIAMMTRYNVFAHKGGSGTLPEMAESFDTREEAETYLRGFIEATPQEKWQGSLRTGYFQSGREYGLAIAYIEEDDVRC